MNYGTSQGEGGHAYGDGSGNDCFTEAKWAKICQTVREEAQRVRVVASFLPLFGPVDPSHSVVPAERIGLAGIPAPPGAVAPVAPQQRMNVDPRLMLPLATIAVEVHLRRAEMEDPELRAALGMFRRAANIVATVEDAIMFNGNFPDTPPIFPGPAVPFAVYDVGGGGALNGGRSQGLMDPDGIPVQPIVPPPVDLGGQVVRAVIAAIQSLEGTGHFGPFACVLGNQRFEQVNTPTGAMVLPADRLTPFLNGPLLRSGLIPANQGVVVSLAGAPVDMVVASDIGVRFLQTTLEPRWVFRVAERVALRVKEAGSLVQLA